MDLGGYRRHISKHTELAAQKGASPAGYGGNGSTSGEDAFADYLFDLDHPGLAAEHRRQLGRDALTLASHTPTEADQVLNAVN